MCNAHDDDLVGKLQWELMDMWRVADQVHFWGYLIRCAHGMWDNYGLNRVKHKKLVICS